MKQEDANIIIKKYIGQMRRILSNIELTAYSLPMAQANNEFVNAIKEANIISERAFIKWQSDSKPNGKNNNANSIKINT